MELLCCNRDSSGVARGRDGPNLARDERAKYKWGREGQL